MMVFIARGLRAVSLISKRGHVSSIPLLLSIFLVCRYGGNHFLRCFFTELGIRDIFCVELGILCSTLKNMNFLVLEILSLLIIGIISLIPKILD